MIPARLLPPALLRAILFAGLIDVLFYRLAPGAGAASSEAGRRILISLQQGGSLMFRATYLLAAACLILLSWRIPRDRRWPPGINGFLGVCFFSLGLLGVGSLASPGGAVVALTFTGLSLVTLLVMAMHAFAVDPSPPARALAVAYSAAAVCSAMHVAAGFVDWPLAAVDYALVAGEIFLSAAAACAFLAHLPPGRFHPLATATAGLAGLGFAAGAVLLPRGTSLLGDDPSRVRIAILACALFLAALTALSCVADPGRRVLGQSLILLMLAGYPLTSAHQEMLMVLGAALLLAPPPAPAWEAGRPPSETIPLTT